MRPVLVQIILAVLLNASALQAQVTDPSPSQAQNILPVEGGMIVMKIDTLTPLPELVSRLDSNWKFLETGKFYWIGYTNDMFSIAARGSEAIQELLRFYSRTQRERGRIGAIYTLHLIGINRQFVGRDWESFVDTPARKALLYLLKDGRHNGTVARLLIRDLWQSDVPQLFRL